MPQPASFKLSICISTFNGAAFIGATLERIISQATNDCEIVVLDGASTDDTERVVTEYVRRFDRLRYVRQDTNNGIDRDFNRAVELARGEYCWLMPDDDLLKPGAVAAVLEALRQDLSLVIVNAEFCDPSMSNVLLHRYLDIGSNRAYGSGEMDRLFVEVGFYITYIGCIVIKRTIWLARDKERYYGTLFNHVGVVFQERLPGEALVIAEPVISVRFGDQRWRPKLFEILGFKWPSVVWSLAPSESAKRAVSGMEPWRSLKLLMICRAVDAYSLTEYRRLIRPRQRSIPDTLAPTLVALLPGMLVNALCVFYYSLSSVRDRGMWLLLFRKSRFHLRNWRVLKRES
jgi:abequosyltransferase